MSSRAEGVAHGARRGSSLVDCLSALAVLAIVVASAAPSVSSVVADAQLRSAAVRLGAALARGRIAAQAEGRPWQLRQLDVAAFGVGPVGGVESREALPGGARFASASSGGAVRFSPRGTAENATFVLTLAGRERRVVLNQRGRVSVE